MAIDTLQIYDDLKASGVPDAQAHAQAKAIADAAKVQPEDMATLGERLNQESERIRRDFSHAIDLLIQKMDLSFKYTHSIGAAIFMAIIANMLLSWFK